MTALNGKQVDLLALRAELVAAGINVSALGTAGDELFTYDEDGSPVDLPKGAAAVVAAHQPPEPPPNVWTVIRSYIPYTEGPEDVLLLTDMIAAAMGGADPEE